MIRSCDHDHVHVSIYSNWKILECMAVRIAMYLLYIQLSVAM